MTSEEREAFYDAEIAPALMEIGKKCLDNGLSMLAVVEYAPGERGTTRCLQGYPGLEMVMLSHCDKMGRNIDGYVIGLARYLKQQGIPIGSSLVLKMMAGELSAAFLEGMASAARNGEAGNAL